MDVDVAYIEVPLAPGESRHFTTFVVEGVVHGTDKQFLLYRPGRYTLRAGKNDKPGASVDVAMPTRQQDIRAYEEWKRQVAARVALAPWYSTQEVDALKQFAADYPDSVYAQYARLAVARYLVEGDMHRDTDEGRAKAVAYLRPLVGDENPAIREHALWLNAQARRVTGKECKRILREILQVNPKSQYADVLWRIVHPSSKRPHQPGEAVEEQPLATEPKATSPVPLDLDRRSLAGLPPGAAALLEQWQTAMARRDVDGALACLSEDFVGNQGSKDDVRRHWEVSFRSAHERSILKQLRFRVEGFHRAASYERPPNDDGWRPPDDQGKRARFQGDLLIVRARATTQTIGSEILTDLTIVLKELDGDKWTIVSSQAKPVNSRRREPDGAKEPK
jgi:hypothetical protein